MRKNRNLRITIVILLFITIVFVGFVIPKETHPPAGTRIILDHNHKTYIAPVCFEESNPTNFIEQTTLEEAEAQNYPPHSQCTEEALESENDRLIISLMKQIGVMKTKWDDW